MLNMEPTRTRTARVKEAVQQRDPVIAEFCKRSLFYFIRTFWDQVAADEPSWNWHVPYLCSQLMRIANKVANNEPKDHDLIINIPPGTTKSITCSVMFPAWCWVNWPWMRFITASYSGQLSLELAEYSRDIVRSSRFKKLFPNLEIKQDKDTKSNFRIQERLLDNTGKTYYLQPGGNRYSTSVGGTLTGFHGHILIVDDPLDPNRAVSEAELKSANRWIDQTLSTRKVNKAVTPTILIMQRLHQNDPTGHILNKNKSTTMHISLPGELKNYQDKIKPVELQSYYQDNLLDPNRMPWTVMQDLEADLGQYGYAGQIGQNPVPPAGGMFQVDNLGQADRIPGHNQIQRVVRYWDKAGSKDGGDYTVGAKLYKLVGDKYILSDIKRGQWSSHEREKIIRQTAEVDGSDVVVYIEQEPGSGGKESAENTVQNLAGFSVHADRPTGDKIYRADPLSVQVNNGNILLLAGCDWIESLKEEFRFFPYGMHDDIVDACSGAFARLALKKKAGVW